MSEQDIRYEEVINALKERYHLRAEQKVLGEVIDGLNTGMSWVLKRYKRVDRPKIMIGEHTGPMTGVNGFTETDKGEKLIGLQVDELRKLDDVDLSAVMEEDYGDDIPVKPELTIRQHYEAFGLEETFHWLQDKGLEGLAQLPDQEERIRPDREHQGTQYLLQPHELEALMLQGIFFKEKYGENPLQQLEDFIRSQQK